MPIIGVNTIYKEVIKLALFTSVWTRPNCWKDSDKIKKKPQQIEPKIKYLLLNLSFWRFGLLLNFTIIWIKGSKKTAPIKVLIKVKV